MTTRMVDSEGRLVLGPQFANQPVVVDDSNQWRIVITPASRIPAAEVWLYQNDEAMAQVEKGLADAKAGRFAEANPDVEADAAESLD